MLNVPSKGCKKGWSGFHRFTELITTTRFISFGFQDKTLAVTGSAVHISRVRRNQVTQ
jgi:hypothetical protein